MASASSFEKHEAVNYFLMMGGEDCYVTVFSWRQKSSRTESLTFFSLLWCEERKQGSVLMLIPFAPYNGESEGTPRLLGRCPLLSSTQPCPSLPGVCKTESN